MSRYLAGFTARVVTLFGALLLAACNPLPPLNFSPQFTGVSHGKIDADLRGVTVSLANPGETTGHMPHDSAIAAPIWRDALQDSINKSGLFDDDSRRRVNIAVKVLKIDIPEMGITFETIAEARYQMIDRKDGAVLYDQVISSTGTVPPDWAFAGVIRRRESINRAVQNNIATFMNSLSQSSVAMAQRP
jgi:hypothetical protein